MCLFLRSWSLRSKWHLKKLNKYKPIWRHIKRDSPGKKRTFIYSSVHEITAYKLISIWDNGTYQPRLIVEPCCVSRTTSSLWPAACYHSLGFFVYLFFCKFLVLPVFDTCTVSLVRYLVCKFSHVALTSCVSLALHSFLASFLWLPALTWCVFWSVSDLLCI